MDLHLGVLIMQAAKKHVPNFKAQEDELPSTNGFYASDRGSSN